MFLDPRKITVSFVLAAVITALGIFALGAQNPSLAITKFLHPFASSDSQSLVSDGAEIVASEASESDQIDEQISQENATIEAEAMVASMNTNYPNNNDDWSLELISDQALEINR